MSGILEVRRADYDPIVELRLVRAKLATARTEYEAHGDNDECPHNCSCECRWYPFNAWYRKDVMIQIQNLESREREIGLRVMGKDATVRALRKVK